MALRKSERDAQQQAAATAPTLTPEQEAEANKPGNRRASWSAADHIAAREQEIAKLKPYLESDPENAKKRLAVLEKEIAEFKAKLEPAEKKAK